MIPSLKMYAIAFGSAALVFLALDAVWLTQMNEILYRRHLSEILLNGFRLTPAIIFYVLYLSGIVYFAIMPAWAEGSLTRAVVNGALLGLICYGTYDLTNQATLKVWSTTVTLADLAWGTFVTSSASAAGFWVSQRFAG